MHWWIVLIIVFVGWPLLSFGLALLMGKFIYAGHGTEPGSDTEADQES